MALKVISSAKLGSLSLKQTSEFQAVGANLKKLDVTFRLLDNGDIAYDGWFTAVSGLGFGINGSFDLERLIVDRGLLRGAYKPLKNRDQQIKDALDANK